MNTRKHYTNESAPPQAVFHFRARSCLRGKPRAGAAELRGFTVPASRLSGFCVLLLGVGAVNAIVLRTLAQLGVGRLIACDMDTYDQDSHRTQPVEPGQQGSAKVRLQATRAHRQNPDVQIIAIQGFAQDLPLLLARSADLIILAGDNLELVVFASQLAMLFGKPVIEASVMGELSTALVRRYDLADPSGACPACAMSEAEWRSLTSRLGCSTDVVGVPGRQRTRTLPAVCGLAAHVAVCEAAKQIALNPNLLKGEEVAYCTTNHGLFRTQLPRNENCRLPHRAGCIVDVPQDATAATLRSIIGPRASVAAMQVKSELPWMHSARCMNRKCGAIVPMRRFAHLDSKLGRCRCGASLIAAPLGRRSVIPADDLLHCLDVPVAELGLQSGQAIGFSTGEDWTYCFPADATVSAWLDKQATRNPHRRTLVGATR